MQLHNNKSSNIGLFSTVRHDINPHSANSLLGTSKGHITNFFSRIYLRAQLLKESITFLSPVTGPYPSLAETSYHLHFIPLRSNLILTSHQLSLFGNVTFVSGFPASMYSDFQALINTLMSLTLSQTCLMAFIV
jgi:hypothetical protein